MSPYLIREQVKIENPDNATDYLNEKLSIYLIRKTTTPPPPIPPIVASVMIIMRTKVPTKSMVSNGKTPLCVQVPSRVIVSAKSFHLGVNY